MALLSSADMAVSFRHCVPAAPIGGGSAPETPVPLSM
jgi:hypothetical protein